MESVLESKRSGNILSSLNKIYTDSFREKLFSSVFVIVYASETWTQNQFVRGQIIKANKAVERGYTCRDNNKADDTLRPLKRCARRSTLNLKWANYSKTEKRCK